MSSNRFTYYIILLALTMQIAGCKKASNPKIGFSPAQVNLDPVNNPAGAVTVNLSKTVNEIVEVWIQMEGPDTCQFGTFNSKFINDDSARITGILSSTATIDTTGSPYVAHLTLTGGTSGFTISLTAANDNFPKRQVQYKLKMTTASNASLSSSSDELTINVASTPMTPQFSSTLLINDPSSGTATYTLQSTTFTPNGSGQWNFGLNYLETAGPGVGAALSPLFANITPAVGPQTYTSTDGFTTVKTAFMPTTTPNSVRGTYYVMADSLTAVQYHNGNITGSGDLQCTFVLF